MSTITMGAVTMGGATRGPAAWNAATAARPRLRITRRGRAVRAVVVAVPLAIVAVLGGIGAVGATATDHSASNSYSYVTVRSGESLWQLAEEIAPNADPRDVVADITDLNGLGSGVIQPGQRLAIPARYAH